MHVVSFIHHFLRSTPGSGFPTPPTPACAYSASATYWSPSLTEWLYRDRLAMSPTPPWALQVPQGRCRLLDVGLKRIAALGDDTGLWAAWVTLGLPQKWPVHLVQEFLAQQHCWRAAYPGQPTSTVREPASGRSFSALQLLSRALAEAAPDVALHIPRGARDERLFVWAALRLPRNHEFPEDDALRGLLDLDPPCGAESPIAFARAWLHDRTIRRWQLHGVVYGFTHHSGIVLHREAHWLNSLCCPRPPAATGLAQGSYFDLALMISTEAALLTLSAWDGSELPGLLAVAPPALADQGRCLLTTWRRVLRQDLLAAVPPSDIMTP